MAPRAKRFSLIGAALVGCWLLATQTGCGKQEDKVANIGTEAINRFQWGGYLRENPGLAAAGQEAAAKEFVRREIAWLQAEKNGLVKGPDWDALVARNRRVVLAKAYLDHVGPRRSAISEAEARSHFLARNEQRHVSHVLCAERSKGDLALVRLKKGEAFGAVADQLSTDPSAKENHGDLGWLRRGETVKPFEDAVFAAKVGELVGPFQSRYGWHVALVEEVKAPAEADFLASRDAEMRNLEAKRTEADREKALSGLRSKYPLAVDEQMLMLDRTTEVAPGDEAKVVAKVGLQTISLKDLKTCMSDSLGVPSLTHTTGPRMKREFMEQMADDVRLEYAARDTGLDKKPDIQAEVWNLDRSSAFDLFRTWYLANAAIPDSRLEDYYRGNQDRFLGPGTLRLYVLVATQRDAALRAVQETSAGTEWQQAVERYANRESTGEWDLGWVEVVKLRAVVGPATAKTLEQGEVGKVVGPFPGPEGLEVFKILERKPGPVEPFSDCKPRIREEFLKANGVAFLNEYLDGPGREGVSVTWSVR